MTEQTQDKKYPLRKNRKSVKRGEKTVMCRLVGRDKTLVPEEEVQHLAEIGSTDREIAEYFDVSESSFRYNFSDILSKGRGKLKQKLRQKQIQVALNGDRVMLIWLGKQYLGQAETPIGTESEQVLPWNDEPLEQTVEEDSTDEDKQSL